MAKRKAQPEGDDPAAAEQFGDVAAGDGPSTPANVAGRGSKVRSAVQGKTKGPTADSKLPAAAAVASPAGSAQPKQQRKRQQAGGQLGEQQPAVPAEAAEAAFRPLSVVDAATRDPLSPEVLQSHAEFFDHLVELVPPRHYHDLDADRVSTKYMKKADRDAAKAAFRKQHKQNKRDKLDPDKAQTSLDLQKQVAAEVARARFADAPAATGAAPVAAIAAAEAAPARPALRLNLTDGAPREELQQRLASKVAALREARHAEERARKTEAAKRFRATNGKPEKAAGAAGSGAKRKRGAAGADGVPGSPKSAKLTAAEFQKQLAEVGSVLSSGQKPAAKRPRAAPEPQPAGELSFGKLAVGTSASEALNEKPRKRRKETKAALLAKAEARAAAAAGAAPSDAVAQAKAAGEAWGAAMARARGEKVLDDPTRLRRSLKKDAKAAAKRAGAWAERQQAQKSATAERVKRRNDNLQARVTAKQEKKKAKREKKLLRPGFEGRRSGFIAGGGGDK